MKFIRNWFDRMVANSVDRTNPSLDQYIESSPSVTFSNSTISGIKRARQREVENDRVQSSANLNFKMFRAENGWVMEVQQYDRRTDNHSNNMHIISESDDLGTAISHILTIESLKV